MALSSTIFKVDLNISDLDRHYYADHQLTIARHPSETDERMMVRILAFVFFASERLAFSKGLCVDDEPALWQKGYSDDIELWIDVGLPDEKRVRKACQRAERVALLLYGGRSAALWWEKNAPKVSRNENLSVFEVPEKSCKELVEIVERSMKLQCTVQDGVLWISGQDINISVPLLQIKSCS